MIFARENFLVVDSRIFQLLVIRNSYRYSVVNEAMQFDLDHPDQIGWSQSDAFLPTDVIRVDFLDFSLFVVTSQT